MPSHQVKYLWSSHSHTHTHTHARMRIQTQTHICTDTHSHIDKIQDFFTHFTTLEGHWDQSLCQVIITILSLPYFFFLSLSPDFHLFPVSTTAINFYHISFILSVIIIKWYFLSSFLLSSLLFLFISNKPTKCGSLLWQHFVTWTLA